MTDHAGKLVRREAGSKAPYSVVVAPEIAAPNADDLCKSLVRGHLRDDVRVIVGHEREKPIALHDRCRNVAGVKHSAIRGDKGGA